MRATILAVLGLILSGHLPAGEPVAGTVLRDCALCPELVVIPPGRFVIGEGAKRPVEGPAVAVTIPQPFALGRFEVTFDEWDACVAAGGCAVVPDDHGWGRGRRPVINIDVAAVEAYLAWLSAHTGRRCRLPSEAEWAYANQAGTTTTWWWGDTLAEGAANCRGCPGAPPRPQPLPVGQFPANPFGLHDTSGNVFEWIADCWQTDLADVPGDGRSRQEQSCRDRVVRGGGWYYVPGVARSAWRGPNDHRAYSYGIGFRVACDLAPSANPAPERGEDAGED